MVPFDSREMIHSNSDDYHDQYFVGVKSMIAFFEALCRLFDEPRHHIGFTESLPYQDKRRHLLFIIGMLCLKIGYCKKARSFFNDAVQLGHKKNKFDWAFTVSQIAVECEACVRKPMDNKQFPQGTLKPKKRKNPLRTQLVSNFLDVLDLPKAVSIAREPNKVTPLPQETGSRIRTWLWAMTLMVITGFLVSSYMIYNHEKYSPTTISLVTSISWIIAFIAAPASLLGGGALGKMSGKLFPHILYPKNLAAITITVVSFSFSNDLITLLIFKNKLPLLIILGAISLILPVFYLNSRFERFVWSGKTRLTRIFDFLNISFLEASTLSALCMSLYGPTFDNIPSKFIFKIHNLDWLYISPLFMLLATLAAVLFGTVVKNMFTPLRFEFQEKNGNK